MNQNIYSFFFGYFKNFMFIIKKSLFSDCFKDQTCVPWAHTHIHLITLMQNL